MKLFKKAKKGFTLVELVVVIAVIAILGAVSVGAYFGITDSANNSKLEQEARMVHTNIQLVGSDTSSNHVLTTTGIKIVKSDIFEDKFEKSIGLKYDFVYGEEPTSISSENNTIYFFNPSAVNPAHTENTIYTHFGYYSPSVGGKRADVDVAKGDVTIVKDLSFTVVAPEGGEDDPQPEEPPVHNHTWDSGEVTLEPTCVAEGVMTYRCTEDPSHTKTEPIAIDASKHVWDSGVVTNDPTCSSTGLRTFTCEHNPLHTKTEDIEINSEAHDWDDGVVTKEATCTEKGVRTFTCSRNPAHTKSEDIEINSDAHNYTSEITKQPTCTEKGIKTYTCTHNSTHTYTEDILVNGEHDWDEGKITKQPTCTEKGIKTYTCKNNPSHTKTEEIAVDTTKHDFTTTPGKCDDCNIVNTEYIYLDASGWDPNSARFAVWTWSNDSDGTWKNLTRVGTTKYFFIKKTELKTNVIFGRMKKVTSTNDWDNVWNQTPDLKKPTNSNNLYTIDTKNGWNNSPVNNWSYLPEIK